MFTRTPGRHRAADVRSADLLIDAAKHHAAPTVKVAGVVAASGGMVIAASMPAQAATAATPAPATAAPAVASVGALGTVSLGGVKKSRLKKVRGTVKKKTAVKRKKATVKRKKTTVKRKRYTAKRYTAKRYTAKRYTAKRVSRTQVRRVVRAKAVNAAPRSAARGGVLGTAASLSGIAYRYGGTTPAGFDCSGYVGYVYRKHGVNLPRTAAAQQAATRRVSAPAPGDLVFFGSRAYHVGIYAGGNMMYDSPRTGRTTGLHKIWSKNVSYGRV